MPGIYRNYAPFSLQPLNQNNNSQEIIYAKEIREELTVDEEYMIFEFITKFST